MGCRFAAVGEAGVADGAPEGEVSGPVVSGPVVSGPVVSFLPVGTAPVRVLGLGRELLSWVGIEGGLLVDLAAVMGGVHCRGMGGGGVCSSWWVVLLVAGRHRRWGLTEARPTLMVGCGYSAMAPHST